MPSAARIDADAFNHGGTPEFATISAIAVRHNDISNILSEAPGRFEPIYRRKPNRDIDARPWRRDFYAAMQLRISEAARALPPQDDQLMSQDDKLEFQRRSAAKPEREHGNSGTGMVTGRSTPPKPRMIKKCWIWFAR